MVLRFLPFRFKLTAARRRCLLAVMLLLAAALFAGCRTVTYYSQAIRGQYQILSRRESCAKLIENPQTSAELKAKLQLAKEICDFAARELELPAKGHYQKYADVGRKYVVWNLSATPEFSLQPRTWWYPIVGSLDYRGFFNEPDAHAAAARLDEEHYDTCVEGVEAYSTLGWFSDPLLNTFMDRGQVSLAELLFHEMAHQRVFAAGDTDFNEAFATTVGEEGVRRWLRAKGDDAAMARYEAALKRNVQFVDLIAATRNKLEKLYGDRRDASDKIRARTKPLDLPPEELRREKQKLLDELRSNYAGLKQKWGGYSGYDDWFAHDLNNAKLNTVATYYDLVPAFEKLLAANHGDLKAFYAAAKKLTRLTKTERRRRLEEVLGTN